jgi:hypothetical protein
MLPVDVNLGLQNNNWARQSLSALLTHHTPNLMSHKDNCCTHREGITSQNSVLFPDYEPKFSDVDANSEDLFYHADEANTAICCAT